MLFIRTIWPYLDTENINKATLYASEIQFLNNITDLKLGIDF